MRLLLTMTSALALSACAVGPNYKAPITPPAAAGAFVTTSAAVTTAAPDDHWWRLYNDPALDQLVAEALAYNTDVRVSVARLQRSPLASSPSPMPPMPAAPSASPPPPAVSSG